MGNKLARTTQASASEYYLHDLPSSFNLVLKESLGKGRFLKSIQCVHDEGLLLVKVYFKRGEVPDLKTHERKLNEIKERLKDIKHSHVWPFQRWLETDKAAYLLRQFLFSNLHDRISTRPFLSIIEKKWLAFQLLHALKQSHEHEVCHGDIKCENVLVTSWNWVYLADFASYKPTYLPADNPADFSFFFDTGSSRRCYVAPERFCEPNDQLPSADAPLKPSMDVFSLGCVIAELFLEGQAIFTLSQLLMYRRGEYDPRPSLDKIPDAGIRDMVLHMIQLNPESRLSSHEYLQTWAPANFPSYFSPLLHNFFSCIVPLDPDTRVAVTQGAFPEIQKQMLADAKRKSEGKQAAVRSTRTSSGVDSIPRGQPHARGSNTKKVQDSIPVAGKFGRAKTFSGDAHLSLLSDINALFKQDRAGGVVGSPANYGVSPARLKHSNSGKDDNERRDDVLDKFSQRSLNRAKSLDVTLSGISSNTSGLDRKDGLGVGISMMDPFSTSEGGHFVPDDRARIQAEGTNQRVKPASIAMADAALAVEEIITEEVFESQVREPGGTFSEKQFLSGDSGEAFGAGRRKEDITLPLEGGWRWEGDWEVDLTWMAGDSGVGVDKEGWRYRKMGRRDLEPDLELNIATAQSGGSAAVKLGPRTGSSRGWTQECRPDSIFRQRRWVRKRRRRPATPLSIQNSRGSIPLRGGDIESSGEGRQSSEQGSAAVEKKCEGMVLIASLLCSCLRHVRLPQARRAGVQLLQDASEFCSDDARLQHVIPYVVALLSDSAAIVRCAALQTLCNVLSMVQTFPPSDAKLFPEYILPLLSMLPDDPEECVRIAYADNIHQIAETAIRFLRNSQYVSESGGLDSPNRPSKSHGVDKLPPVPGGALSSMGLNPNHVSRFEQELSHLRESIARVIQELVIGQKQTPTIRRALLKHVGSLCEFFGKKQSNDFLLPILPAFLNDRDEQLRAVFFEHIISVCLFIGQMSVEAYLLPYIEQALSDVEETVIVNSLECLAALCSHRMLRKRILLGAVERASPLLCHPSQWVRKAAITFVAATSANLDVADSYAFLSPILAPFLRREPASLCSESALAACLKPPVSREVFNRVLSALMLSQTAPEPSTTKVVHQRKGRQRPALQHPLEPATIATKGSVLDKRRTDREVVTASATAESRHMKSFGSKLPSFHGLINSYREEIKSSDFDDGEKMKAMEGYIRNLSSTMQTRMHNWEVENTEKMQTSAIGLATGGGTGYYSQYDGSGEGIPLYSFPVNEKKYDGQTMQGTSAQISPSLNEEWSRIFGARQGNVPYLMATVAGAPMGSTLGVASSQWATIGATHSAMMPTDPYQRSGTLVGSLYNGGHFNASTMFDMTRDTYIREVDGAMQSVSIKQLPGASLDAALQGNAGLELSLDGLDHDPTMESLGESELGASAMESSWRPRGVLVAHLQEHQQAVNEVAVSPDSVFFLSACDDGTVKVWDFRRLERDISFRSRLTYGCQGGRVLRVTTFGSGHQAAAATSTGAIHVFSVEYVGRMGSSSERYSGFSEIMKLESQEGAVTSLQSFGGDGPPLLLYSTLRTGIHLWDVRKQSDAWVLRTEPFQGYITATALDCNCNWLVSATSRGFLTLWDLRFHIPVNSWFHPSGCSIECMSTLLPSSGGPSKSSGRPYVYIAAGKNELGLWNAEDGSCLQVLQLQSDTGNMELSEIPAALQQPKAVTSQMDQKVNPKNRYRTEELNDPPSRLPGIRALLPVTGGHSIICGGTDLRIRLWDRLRPEKSYSICGPTIKGPASPEAQVYSTKVVSGVRIVQEHPNLDGSTGSASSSSRLAGSKIASKTNIASAAVDTAGCHRDSITSLALGQTNQRFLISSSRDGAVKVWK